MGRIPFPIGTCTDCGSKNKKLITKRCFDEPNFCYTKYRKARYKAKQEKKQVVNVKKEKSVPELIQLAVIVFHKYIRKRDTINGTTFICISCQKPKSVSVLQAGHYLPAGNNASVRLNDWNVNGQCEECNINKNGNQAEYRKGLIEKIGLPSVEALEESAKIPFKWDKSKLMDIIKQYKSA